MFARDQGQGPEATPATARPYESHHPPQATNSNALLPWPRRRIIRRALPAWQGLGRVARPSSSQPGPSQRRVAQPGDEKAPARVLGRLRPCGGNPMNSRGAAPRPRAARTLALRARVALPRETRPRVLRPSTIQVRSTFKECRLARPARSPAPRPRGASAPRMTSVGRGALDHVHRLNSCSMRKLRSLDRGAMDRGVFLSE